MKPINSAACPQSPPNVPAVHPLYILLPTPIRDTQTFNSSLLDLWPAPPSWYRAFPPFFHLLRQFLSPRLLSIISDYMRQHSYKQHLRYKGTECDSRSRQPLWQNSRYVLMYYCGRSSIIVPTRPNNIDSQAGVVSLRPPRSGRQFNAKVVNVVQTDPPSKYWHLLGITMTSSSSSSSWC